jgi:hypothetical protein
LAEGLALGALGVEESTLESMFVEHPARVKLATMTIAAPRMSPNLPESTRDVILGA